MHNREFWGYGAPVTFPTLPMERFGPIWSPWRYDDGAFMVVVFKKATNMIGGKY